MLATELVITIPGESVPKGSLRCIGRSGRHQLIEDNPRTKEWRATVALWVKRKWQLNRAEKGQPLGAEVTFTLPRPKGHYGTGRNRTILRASAPPEPVSHAAGDVDKLVRLALDALQDAGTIPDDSQIVDLHARKAYAHDGSRDVHSDVLTYPGVVIRLYPYEAP